jgi:DNA mismatch repair protein MSH2
MDQEGQRQEKNQMFMCIGFLKNYRVACCLISQDEHRIKVAEFQDNKFFMNTESLLIQLLPSRQWETELKVMAFMPSEDKDCDKVEKLFEGLEVQRQSARQEELKGIRNDMDVLVCLLRNPISHYMKKAAGHETAVDMAIFCAYRFDLVKDKTNHGQFDIVTVDLDTQMKLDRSALTSLNMFSAMSDVSNMYFYDRNKDKSLFGIINNCKTSMGQKTLRRWILQPLVSLDTIEVRLDVVQFLVSNDQMLKYIMGSFLGSQTDVDRIAVKLFRVQCDKPTNCGLAEVCKLYQSVKTLKYLKAYVDNYPYETDRHLFEPLIELIKKQSENFLKFYELVETYVDFEMLQHGVYRIRPEVNTDLGDIRRQMANLEKNITHLYAQAQEQLQTEVYQEKDGNGGYMFRVAKKLEKRVAQFPAYKLITSRGNYIKLSTHELKLLSLEKNELEGKYEASQRAMVLKIVKIVATYYQHIEEMSEFIAELDAICSLAIFSKSSFNCKKVRPKFNEGKDIRIEGCRHPILDRYSPTPPVANNLEMNREESSFHIITGPNMGGKSTFIRQIAVNIILAQMGCFCSADYFEIPVFDNLITRVGAGDAQSKGLSTWMNELLEVSCMLESASKNTFLIIDELGRGTSTSEGVGMTYAIAEHIIKHLGSYCLFATHFFELVKLSEVYREAKNFHVEAHESGHNIVMDYRIKPGATDKSLGLYILKMLKFPSEILGFATGLTTQITSACFEVQNHPKPKLTVEYDAGLDMKVQRVKAVKQEINRLNGGGETASEGKHSVKMVI